MSTKTLIVCSHFWPSRGGLESRMGQFSVGLQQAGYDVTVLTQHFPGRPPGLFHGVKLWNVAWADLQVTIRTALASGDWDTCILVQDPLGFILWSLEGLEIPAHTRMLMQPIINEEGYGRWKDHPDFGPRLAALLKSANVALTMTRSGPDERFMRATGVPAVYLPNATEPAAPTGDFRLLHGIAPDRFIVLHVANLFWVKNHIGLIDALEQLPTSWQLVMIGHPSGSADCVAAVREKLASRPDILYIPGLPAGEIAAAMQASDVVVLASHGEGSPITILESMAHGKPWLATPQCGAANDHLGGLISELGSFREHLQLLQRHPELRRQLGDIGRRHWQQCYSWPVVLQGWRELIDGGHLQRPFLPAADLIDEMANLRKDLQRLAIGNGDESTLVVAAEQSPPDATTIVSTAQHLVQEGHADEAIAVYRDWLRNSRSPVAFAVAYNMSITLEAAGRFEDAEAGYRRSLALKPDFVLSRLALARVLMRQGERQEPLNQARWVVEHAADDTQRQQAGALLATLAP